MHLGVGSGVSAFLILFHIDITVIISRFGSGCNCECRALWCVTVMQKMSGPLWLFVTVNKLTEDRGTARIPWCDITKGRGCMSVGNEINRVQQFQLHPI